VSIRRFVAGATVQEDGAAVFDPKRALDFLKEQKGKAVTLATDEDKAVLRAGRAKTELGTHPPDDFPSYERQGGETAAVTLPARQWKRLIGMTEFCADKREGARWAVTGVKIDVAGGKLNAVATDTKRLAVATDDAVGSADGSCLVPLKATTLVNKNFGEDGELVTLKVFPNAAEFSTDRWVIRTRLVEGKFPPYQQIIPKKLDHAAEVRAGDFASAVRSAMVATDDDAKRVQFAFANGECVMSASGENGHSEAVADVPGFDGDVRLAMDPKYVLDMLNKLNDAEVVTIRFTDENKPVLFDVGSNYRGLVMPLGTKGG
jgi:DNA polymerase-3 subunit beta